MRRIRYFQLDVFTDSIFSGNQLAVFTEGASLTSEEMQAIAREMNFSESVFVLPAASPRAVARLRIFTPEIELPFAGHPVIGATFALAEAGDIAADTDTPVTLETGVGPLAIDLLFEDGHLQFAWMRQPIPAFQPWQGDRNALAAALGIASDDLRDDLPIEHGSAGVPFYFVPVASQAALDQARPGPAVDAALVGAERYVGAYLFVTPEAGGAAHVSARMFAQGVGIVEDAATGSAAGPLGVYLVRHNLIASADSAATAIITQGVKMGRPSRLLVSIAHAGTTITQVRVGGEAVVVAEGEFRLPDAPARP